jgi:hypothetical protein
MHCVARPKDGRIHRFHRRKFPQLHTSSGVILFARMLAKSWRNSLKMADLRMCGQTWPLLLFLLPFTPFLSLPTALLLCLSRSLHFSSRLTLYRFPRPPRLPFNFHKKKERQTVFQIHHGNARAQGRPSDDDEGRRQGSSSIATPLRCYASTRARLALHVE